MASMRFHLAIALALFLAGASSFAPVLRPAAKTSSTTPLKGIYYLDDVYVPEKSPLELPQHAVPAMSPPTRVSEGQIRALFYLWNDALATGDSRIVAKRYSEEPFLLLAGSDTPCTDYDSIVDYFDKFLKLKPQGDIISGNISIGNGWARDTGIYEFTFGKDGWRDNSKLKARYTFDYVYKNGQWKIGHQHSSLMPEESSRRGPVDVSEDQIRNLFVLWNDALSTLSPELVISRYSKNAVFLPTASDIPRTDHNSIKEYFDKFLKLQPQYEVIVSHVTVGDGWAKDVGIYEFTMKANGSTLRARYSFVYIFEDQCWKISHHHSSLMPQSSLKGPKMSEDQVKNLFHLWNDALATLDSDTVARRYAANAVFLSDVSDTPRTDYESIKEYYEAFLPTRPQYAVLQSFATVGDGWCKDVGIYECLVADGTKVKSRYSFVYVFEESSGQWKIAHHHSSVMPRTLLTSAALETAVKDHEVNGHTEEPSEFSEEELDEEVLLEDKPVNSESKEEQFEEEESRELVSESSS